MIAMSLHGTDIAHQDEVAAVVNDIPPTTLLAAWIPWLIPSSFTCHPHDFYDDPHESQNEQDAQQALGSH